ncbi:NADP-dependent malic enzyme [Neorickettsia helminthoeca str. Oregon]|uniref:NADP-dependent malic enzyme n=1 Tax=Neorickettsia helminthoeca str. Oregon TaxID=1286528 RepID=X5H451_9RICK|nr:NADP-dependent malic enzyme [Neorickettsia helminthoeca]AHX11346.1 NADP-dependent malic enzyme [Neorickettsia helminthoeca str. Oregon]
MAKAKSRETINIEALQYHSEGRPGKLGVHATKPLLTQEDLSLAYSPGVAQPCLEIKNNPLDAYKYTSKGNLVAVISNGTAVLGLGNLGAAASKPVMEGKAVLFKKFADIESIDIEVNTEDVEEFISTVKNIAGTFGGINLEDIKSPECFEIEQRLAEMLDVPVFHDDQHGTAIIVCAGLINAADLTGRRVEDLSVVVNGCGAAGIACIELMKNIGVSKIIVCDQSGVIKTSREFAPGDRKAAYAVDINADTLEGALKNADVFVGLSVANVLKPEWLSKMNRDPVIFALANPDPEIDPELAKKVRPDAIVATGRSDYGNQINNVMCFPYLFRGALDVNASKFNTEMKLAAVKAIADIARMPISAEVMAAYSNTHMQYGKDYIIPKPFDQRLIVEIAPAVARAAIETGVARKTIKDFGEYRESLIKRVAQVSTNLFGMISGMLRENKKRVIFAEGEEIRSIRVAVQWRDMGYGTPILVGRSSLIEERMQEMNLSSRSGIEILNAAVSKKNDEYIEYMYRTLQRKGFLHRRCVRDIKTDRNVFAACLLAAGDGDAMITGLTRSYSDCLNDVVPIIGVTDTVFSMSIIITDKDTFFVCDAGIDNIPDAQDLAEIAIKGAEVVQGIGSSPRVAIIANSNFGSSNGESALRAREAVEILDDLGVSFEYEGEMEVDTALNERSRDIYPFLRLSGAANVLVMPSAEAASALCKFSREIMGTTVIGPILLGLNKSVQIVQPSYDVSEILNLALIAAKTSSD